MNLLSYSYRYIYFCFLYFESILRHSVLGFYRVSYFLFIFHFWPLKDFCEFFSHVFAMFKSVFIIFYLVFLLLCWEERRFSLNSCFPFQGQIFAVSMESSKLFSFLLWKLSLSFVVDLSEQLNLMVQVCDVVR